MVLVLVLVAVLRRCGSGGKEAVTTARALSIAAVQGSGLIVAGGAELKYPSVRVLSAPHDGQERVAV